MVYPPAQLEAAPAPSGRAPAFLRVIARPYGKYRNRQHFFPRNSHAIVRITYFHATA